MFSMMGGNGAVCYTGARMSALERQRAETMRQQHALGRERVRRLEADSKRAQAEARAKDVQRQAAKYRAGVESERANSWTAKIKRFLTRKVF